MHVKFCSLVLFGCLLGGFAAAESPEAPPLYQQPKWWWVLWGPAKSNPVDQLAYAEELEAAGKERKARRHFLRLANFWPEAPEAPYALIAVAEMYQADGKLRDAFNAYQDVINRYAGSFDYLEIVKEQVRIAGQIQKQRSGGLGPWKGFEAPERALPYYQQIMTNAPQWEKAAEVQFTIGAIQEEVKDYELAINSYEMALSRFPESPWAEPASFHKALCMLEIARYRPNDDAAAESAWAMLTQFLNNHEGSELAAEALKHQKEMRDRLAKSFFEKAQYYDGIINRPKSALIAYKSFLEQFPNSEWTEQAQSRIEALEALTAQE